MVTNFHHKIVSSVIFFPVDKWSTSLFRTGIGAVIVIQSDSILVLSF